MRIITIIITFAIVWGVSGLIAHYVYGDRQEWQHCEDCDHR